MLVTWTEPQISACSMSQTTFSKRAGLPARVQEALAKQTRLPFHVHAVHVVLRLDNSIQCCTHAACRVRRSEGALLVTACSRSPMACARLREPAG